jgi:diguanylate cyclase (GGDEF)-like protein
MLSLRNIIPLSIVILVPHILVVWAYIEIKRGLSLFYEIKNRVFTDLIIISIFTVSLLYNDTDARLRIISVCIASIFVFLDTVILVNSRKARKKRGKNSLSLLFSIAILVMAIRLILGLQWDPLGDPLETGNNLSIISILFFITNIVIFFTIFFIVFNTILHERNELIEKIKSESLTDELTGMMNRRGFRKVLDYEMNHFSRTDKGFTFVMCDIDHFKKVNDEYGHDYGDFVLKEISEILKKNMRKVDTTARWGGEEFVILFPSTSLEQSQIALERIKREIEQLSFSDKGHVFNKTMSFGACYCKNPDLEIEAIFLNTDKNLYNAKETGRNKIVASIL